jgi:hypothetical protein
MMRKVLTGVVAGAALVLFTAGVAAAGGPPTTHQTRHLVGVTQTFASQNPCTGAPGTVTVTFNGVQHFTQFADGTVHATETSRGTFSFDASPADGDADASGTYTSWDGANGLFDQNGNFVGRGEQSFTLNGRGTNADDGSTLRFHNNGHARADSFGNVVQQFFKAQCN